VIRCDRPALLRRLLAVPGTAAAGIDNNPIPMDSKTEPARSMASREHKAEVKSCGILVFREKPALSFLLMEHAHRWDLPKGHVDPGETERQTALRELYEETGISGVDLRLDPDFCYRDYYAVRKQRYGTRPVLKELVVFMGTLTRPSRVDPLNLTEHIGYHWFDWNPPHSIQQKTIDPLLEAVHCFWEENPRRRLRSSRRS
jgi:8-oxo-dGTP pyrophosphatase MutT (NUDIX family)